MTVSLPIEDYGFIGDTHTGALVGRDGSIDWLCFPRFDSPACFAALLGTPEHGRWLIAPAGGVRSTRRKYREGTLVLESEYETDEGVVRVIDCMPHRTHHEGGDVADVLRVVEGVEGRVPMSMELVIRFEYGSVVPWVESRDDGLHAVAGPDALTLRTPVETRGVDRRTVADFTVDEGERVPFTLTWHQSHLSAPEPQPVHDLIEETTEWWREWSSRCGYEGPWRDAVVHSLVVLKALTYEPTGGVVAALTTSLPEHPGGERNWDYRYCWLRDATFTLNALLLGGHRDEAVAWRDWLLRAVAGDPGDLQIMYGAAGERRLHEWEVAWLPGYEHSRPVRVGNAAHAQFQLDVFGEVMDSLAQARQQGMEPESRAWDLQRVMLDRLEERWREPDEGIWEVRGARRHFTHSKLMAWVAFDRAVRAVEVHDLDGPARRWREIRDEIHGEVCQRGFDPELGAFTQAYDSTALDASLLMIPLVGFLPATDGRVVGTVEAIQRDLCEDGFVKRYRTTEEVDGLPPQEGTFLLCTFWLAQCLGLMGREEEAHALFGRLLEVGNDLGLLSEQFDPGRGRLLGNFPQAFSHVGLINTACALTGDTRATRT